MYSTRTGLILGFHGCDLSIAEDIVSNKTYLKGSENSYDWLGHGIYFWENSPLRAMEYAMHLSKTPHISKNPIKKPAVIGAVLNLGFCLDLVEYENTSLLKLAYSFLEETLKNIGKPLPENKATNTSNELLIRELDCAVINSLFHIRRLADKRPFDSVRGVFLEGNEVYPNAGFKEKTHTQICIVNPNCIKGYFLPLNENQKYAKV